MTQPLSVDELAMGLARRGTPLAPESAMFIVLEAVESMAARPVWLTPEGVLVGDDGVVTLAKGLDDVSVLEAMTSAMDTLEAVLTPAPHGIQSLARRVQTGDVEALPVFTSELEALLVPLNRSAARRMLGRLVREHLRTAERPAAHEAGTGTDEARHKDALDTVPDGGVREPSRAPRAVDESVLDDGGDDRPTRQGGSRGLGIVAVVLAAIAVLAAGMFLYHRIQVSASRAGLSQREGSIQGSSRALSAAR